MVTWWLLISAIFLSNVFESSSKDGWQKPGCFKVGHTRRISIPSCVEFRMQTNACRGYCESWAVPSGPLASPAQPVTSVAQCCSMMETETVEAQVYCVVDGVDSMRNVTFKSAKTCSCFHCKKD